MSEDEQNRMRKVYVLARKLLQEWNHPLALQHCKEMAKMHRGSRSPAMLSNAVLRDLIREFMSE